MRKIYIVEDDEDIREMVLYALQSGGYEAAGFESGEDFHLAIAGELPDLVILDIMLPGEDGLSTLKSLRSDERTKALPVIMATAKGSEFDKIKGLDLGADDYLTKPFSVMELISRVGAVLRRGGSTTAPTPPSEQLEYDGILLDNTRRTVLVHGETVALTYKEYELLHFLMLKKDIALDRDRIMQAVWGYSLAETRTLDAHIRSLRQKLGAAGSYIKTMRNIGYKFGE